MGYGRLGPVMRSMGYEGFDCISSDWKPTDMWVTTVNGMEDFRVHPTLDGYPNRFYSVSYVNVSTFDLIITSNTSAIYRLQQRNHK